MNVQWRIHTTIGASAVGDAHARGVQAAQAAQSRAGDADTLAVVVITPTSVDVEAVQRGVREVVGNVPLLATNLPADAASADPDGVQVYLLSTFLTATDVPANDGQVDAHDGVCEACANTGILRNVLDTLPFGIFWKDTEGRYLGCNKRFAANAGLASPAEIVGCTDHMLCWAEYADQYNAADHEVITTGHAKINIVEPVIRADGNRVWISTSKFPLRDATGRVFGFLGTYEDVNELRAAIEEIAEGEYSYREIFNASNDAMFITSTTATILDANERACEIFGYTHAEIVRLTIFDTSHGEPPFAAADAFERIGALTAGESKRFEWLHKRRDGTPLWMEVSLRLAKINGRDCIVSSMRDVTERKQMEEELRTSRERYMAYFHMLPDAAGISRASNGELIEVNQAFLDMFGWTQEEAIGKTSIDLGLWANPENRRQLLELAAKSPIGAQREYSFKNSKGESGVAIFCFRLFREHGEQLIYFICKDITDLKGASDALRSQADSLKMANMQLEVQSQHLRAQQEDLITANRQLEASKHAAEVASRAKGEFLTTMSHELLTPLTAILGYAEQLGGTQDRNADPERTAAIETIMRNGQQLTGILRSILDLSMIDAGEFKVDSSLCSPKQILDEVHELLRLKAESKHLKLETKVKGLFPTSVETDPTRLRQVLVNLVDNAVKFTEEGGISVTASIDYHGRKGPMLEIEVRDSGVGMTEEVIANLFEPFRQADMSCARQFQGTGLGLSICKRVCQLLGGDIKVSSTLGRGCTFVATFAVSIPANALPIHPACAKAAAGTGDALSCRILLAEDSLDNQRLLTVILEKAGADLTVVEDGQEAIDAIAAAEKSGRPFDVVLMDMQMPVLDGYEAASRLRASGCKLPILALTAHGMTGDREKCLAAGCTDYATKPIRRDALISTIRSLLRKGGDGEPATARPSLDNAHRDPIR